MSGSLYLGSQKVCPVLVKGNSGGSTDDWGQSLQGDVEIDNTFICAPYKCCGNQKITSFSAQNVTDAVLYYCFYNCTSLTSVPTFANLTTVGQYGLYLCFSGCTSLTTAPTFANLTTVGQYGLYSCFSVCTSLTTAPTFANLTTIGQYGLAYCFANSTSLSSISFPALTTTSFGSYVNQFNNMVSGISGCTIHFPSNLETTIQGLQGYPTFGGTNTVLAFDLPATS